MKSLIFYISFSEAFFRNHFTRKYRLSYPSPLPTSISGILGSILGIKREILKEYFRNFYFGAKILKTSFTFENTTLIEIATNEVGRSVEKSLILNEPEYEIAILGEEKKVEEIKKRIIDLNFHFLPFGGQNDYFLKSIKLIGEGNVEEKDEAYGYFPIDIVEKVEGRFWVFPVKYRNLRKDFIFSEKKVKLKEKTLTVNEIAVYKLDDFYLI